MPDLQIHPASAQFSSQGLSLKTYLAEPVRTGLFPAIIVFQEIFGVNAHNSADHGFFCDRRANYNPEAATDAWKQVQQLFPQKPHLNNNVATD